MRVLPVVDIGRYSVKTHITASNSTATFVAVEFETPDLPPCFSRPYLVGSNFFLAISAF
jgi:hypothetical protein